MAFMGALLAGVAKGVAAGAAKGAAGVAKGAAGAAKGAAKAGEAAKGGAAKGAAKTSEAAKPNKFRKFAQGLSDRVQGIQKDDGKDDGKDDSGKRKQRNKAEPVESPFKYQSLYSPPSKKQGGRINKTGVYRLHKGEVVVPAKLVGGKSTTRKRAHPKKTTIKR